MSRAKDLEPSTFSGKEVLWPKFKEELMDHADAVHAGIKNQLEYSLKPREEVTQFVLECTPLGSSEYMWNLRDELYKVLKRKTEATSEARKIVECVEHNNGYKACGLLGVRHEAQEV